MTDIVIPYKHFPHKSSIELRYALRSIEKHLAGYRNVYLIGGKPDWIQNVMHIDTDDIPQKKQRSICRKLLIACAIPELSESFISWHDDHYVLHPLDVKDFKFWYDGTVEQERSRAEDGRYRDVLTAFCKTFDPKAYFHDIHTPFKFNTALFSGEMKFIVEQKKELPIKSTYCFLSSLYFGIRNSAHMPHLKISASRSENEIRSLIKDRLFFSTGAHIEARPNMLRVLESLYPEKSQYEK